MNNIKGELLNLGFTKHPNLPFYQLDFKKNNKTLYCLEAKIKNGGVVYATVDYTVPSLDHAWSCDDDIDRDPPVSIEELKMCIARLKQKANNEAENEKQKTPSVEYSKDILDALDGLDEIKWSSRE